MVQATSASAPEAAPVAHVRTTADTPLRVLRIVQFIFSVVVTGLTGYVVNANRRRVVCDYDIYGEVYSCETVSFTLPGELDYMVFAGAWGIITSLYLLPSSFATKMNFTMATLVLDILNMIIWFSAFIALAAFLGIYTGGEGDQGLPGLQILEAADVFGALLWLSFIATLFFTLKRRKAILNEGGATSAPVMQQYPNAGVAQHPGAHA